MTNPLLALIAKNEEFTLVEFNLMRIWLEGVLRGLGLIGFNVDHKRMLQVSADVLLTGLRLEHWISLIPVLDDRTPEQNAQTQVYRNAFEPAIREFEELVKDSGFSEDGFDRLNFVKGELLG